VFDEVSEVGEQGIVRVNQVDIDIPQAQHDGEARGLRARQVPLPKWVLGLKQGGGVTLSKETGGSFRLMGIARGEHQTSRCGHAGDLSAGSSEPPY
jgi:hypothetical protein